MFVLWIAEHFMSSIHRNLYTNQSKFCAKCCARDNATPHHKNQCNWHLGDINTRTHAHMYEWMKSSKKPENEYNSVLNAFCLACTIQWRRLAIRIVCIHTYIDVHTDLNVWIRMHGPRSLGVCVHIRQKSAIYNIHIYMFRGNRRCAQLKCKCTWAYIRSLADSWKKWCEEPSFESKTCITSSAQQQPNPFLDINWKIMHSHARCTSITTTATAAATTSTSMRTIENECECECECGCRERVRLYAYQNYLSLH